MHGSSYTFSHAIVRAVPDSAVGGLRAVDVGAPDLDRFRGHHADYVAALRRAGVAVTELPASEAFPDSMFVEDAALCLPQGAVVMRPGAPSRLGEADAMAPHLRDCYSEVACIGGPGHVEGGDILVGDTEIMVGLSDRTDAAGVAELGSTVAPWGWTIRIVETPPGVLHFKTDCSLMDSATVLATPRLAASGCFAGYAVIETAAGEEACANAIRV
ncbi:MAG: arginine deiminase family protein, partial [Pseudomonadota bacterium]